MKNRSMTVVFFLSLFLVAACNVKYTPELVQHIKGSSFKATDTGYYTAELVMKPSRPAVGKNKAHLIIHDYEATDIPGLDIAVTPVRVAGGVKSPETPVVTDKGRGLYIIENIVFPEPGDWEIHIGIKGPFKNDRVVLQIPEVTAGK